MTVEELFQNKELYAECAKEVEEKFRQCHDLETAKREVFKAHGVEFDEDAAKAAAVGKMELSEDELDHVAGGLDWCWSDHACSTIRYHADTQRNSDSVCWADVNCIMIADCTLDGMQ